MTTALPEKAITVVLVTGCEWGVSAARPAPELNVNSQVLNVSECVYVSCKPYPFC